MPNREANYEIVVYARDGEPLSLSSNPETEERQEHDNIWSALADLSRIPAYGWRHWDDAPEDSSELLIKEIRLYHTEIYHRKRGTPMSSTNLLETIKR